MPSTTFHVDAVLFDMDGTLVDSTAGVTGAWDVFKRSYPWNQLQRPMAVRTRESERFEHAIVSSAAENGDGIVRLPGVKAVMDQILTARSLPDPSWAICTSATRSYCVPRRSVLAGVPVPDVLVVAEDVTQGKPCPDPYLLGAKKCGVPPENCVVFEDAPAGVRSGAAAGCKTVGLLTSHTRAQMEACSPDFLVQDMASVSMKLTERGIDVTVTTP
ncbi:HAD-like domain-containing protein [Mycena rebaudengoi]|nr:HAD-like domain-containing protein [Mycena rebaudengoi]